MARRILVNLDLNQNELQNARAHVLSARPGAPVTGQFLYDSDDNQMFYWNGTAWVAMDGTSVPYGVVGNISSIEPDDAASAGVSANVARADHQHAIVAAAPGNITPDAAASEGVATSFARSDHVHGLTTVAPTIGLGTAAAEGVATTFIRSDATILAFDATSPTTQAIGDAAVVGVATVAARRDHKHAMPGFGAVVTETAYGQASANGVAVTIARSDHTHGTPTHVAADHAAIKLSDLAAPTADVSMGGFKLTNLGTPTAATDAVTKAYVDAARMGLDVKDSVRAATTAAIAGATYNATAGASARGQFTTMPNTIDGVALAVNDRVLVKDQAAPAQNGIWVVTTLGTGANGVWDRATDFDQDAEVTSGAFTFVTEGTTNDNSGWVLTTNDPITVGGAGGSSLVFVQFSGAGQITAGTGMSKTGNTLNVGAGLGMVANADDVAIDPTVVARKYTTTVGDGVATSYVITHSLNTRSVVAQVFLSTTPWDEVECEVERTSVNTITLRFNTAPTAAQYTVAVVG